jgi:hypothetical protein
MASKVPKTLTHDQKVRFIYDVLMKDNTLTGRAYVLSQMLRNENGQSDTASERRVQMLAIINTILSQSVENIMRLRDIYSDFTIDYRFEAIKFLREVNAWGTSYTMADLPTANNVSDILALAIKLRSKMVDGKIKKADIISELTLKSKNGFENAQIVDYMTTISRRLGR